MSLKYTLSPLIYSLLGFLQLLGAQPTTVDKIVAKINHHIVLKSELEAQFLGSQSSGTGLSQCEILEGLISNQILVSRAELDSIPLSDQEVEANLESRMSFMVNQVGSEEKLKELYGKSVQQLKSELQEAVRDQLLIEKMRQTLIGTLNVSPLEVRTFFEKISAADRPYYSMQVRLAQLVEIVSPGIESESITQSQLLSLRKQLLDGEDFESLARRYSEDPSAARNGGHLGFFPRGALDPAYEATALSLSPGEVSLPVRSSFGYHLIERLEIRGNSYDSRHILLIPQPTEKDYARHSAFLDSLRLEVLDKKISFETTAMEHSKDSKTAPNGGFFEGKEGIPFISVEDLDPLLFFSIDTMQVGTLSHPMRYTQEDGKQALRILYYKEKIPPHQANFNTDYTRLSSASLREKQDRILSQWMKTAHQDLFIHIDTDYAHCEVYKMTNHTRK